MVLEDILVPPDNLARGSCFVEVTAMPDIPRWVETEGCGVRAVIPKIAIWQDHRVAPRAHRHRPAVCLLTLGIDEIDNPAAGLSRVEV